MEETFGLTWEDSTTVVQAEEVICGIENEILPAQSEEFTGVPEGVTEEVVMEPEEGVPQENAPVERIVYLSDGNVIVMEDTEQPTYQEELINCDVAEEVITEQWGESCPEEIIVGSEEAVGDVEETNQGDSDIPLPTDQDEYTAARPYPCDFCSRRFRKKANLMNHMVAHQTDRPHGCNLCGVRYIRKCDLMNHLKIHAYIPEGDGMEEEDMQSMEEYSEPEKGKKKKQVGRRRKKEIKEEYEPYEGASSSKDYTYMEDDQKFIEHIQNDGKDDSFEYLQEEQPEEEIIRYPVTDPKKPFVCQHCGVGFAREKALQSHMKVHAEGDSPFECQKCGEMFWDPGQMRDHAKDKHGDMDDYDDDEDEDYSGEEEAKYGTYYCSTCGLSFHRQDNLRRHQRVHVKEEYVNEHEFGHVCNVCGESFPEALDLLAHAEVHARSAEYRCMICGEITTDESALAVHVQAKHGKNLPPNTCMLCGRACKDRRTLLKHNWEHSKEKIYGCSKCAKTFHNKARLKRHMLSHRKKVVNCDVCGEEFPDGRSLMNHRHSHSSVSGRQFPCRECGKTFGSRSSQQIHIRIHTGERPYGCRFCWKAFADGGTLRKHERIHTGEKPYACAVCPRAFNQRVVLREHIRSHHSGPDPKYTNSMTPYCCSVCSDMFATSQDLILHLIHHCDLNTAMKRQPQVGPRKYKRRRKLKPHELEMISSRMEEDDNENIELLPYQGLEESTFTDSEEEKERKRKYTRRQTYKKASMSPKEQQPVETTSPYEEDIYNNSSSSAIENANNSLVNFKVTPPKGKTKKLKVDQSTPSRPKMIHTQKTRVPVETCEDGRVRHKTKTMVTRTQPTEIKSAIGERIRPRTKNVSYHILQSEKLPIATFPDSDSATERAVESILKEEQLENEASETSFHEEQEQIQEEEQPQHSNGIIYMDDLEQAPEVAAEQTIESETSANATNNEVPVPVTMVEVRKRRSRTLSMCSLKPGRTIIGPGSKVRLIKEGMIVSKVKNNKSAEPESILPDNPQDMYTPETQPPVVVKQEVINVKEEIQLDPSALHELAEITMQHASANAQNLFKCEMCSEVFSDRAQLLVHVPIHI